jgi:hypothetical protein
MKNFISLAFLCCFISLLTGCGQSSSPVHPEDPSREVQEWDDPIKAFNFSAGNHYWDVDLATVAIGPGIDGTPGDIWHQEAFGNVQLYWCAAVSLFQEIHIARPYYSWMRTDSSQGNNPMAHIQQGYASHWPQCKSLFKLPKCDALCLVDDFGVQENIEIIELAVCYMVKVEGIHPYWSLGVTLNTWSVGPGDHQFPLNAPDQEDNWVWDEGVDVWHPDISYDPDTGDIYLVYTVVGSPAVVHYRRYNRENHTWSASYPIHPADHGGWTPRIDVGLYPDGNTWTVGVAYSAFNQGEHAGKWHPCIVHWNADEPDGPKGNNLIPVWNENWQYSDLDSGLPELDIGPNSNSQHYGALVYVQEEGEPGGQINYQVYEIDSILQQPVRIFDETAQLTDSMHPSIALHYDGGSPLHEASISYFGKSGMVIFQPQVCRINMDLPRDDPYKVYNYEPIESVIFDSWVPLDVLDIHPALSSSIVVRLDHGYWAGFCDRVHFDPADLPDMVWVAFGRSNG